MNNTVNELKTQYETFLNEDAKFTEGNAAAGTRARKALAEMSKLIKSRRTEITSEKNARAEAKKAAK